MHDELRSAGTIMSVDVHDETANLALSVYFSVFSPEFDAVLVTRAERSAGCSVRNRPGQGFTTVQIAALGRLAAMDRGSRTMSTIHLLGRFRAGSGIPPDQRTRYIIPTRQFSVLCFVALLPWNEHPVRAFEQN